MTVAISRTSNSSKLKTKRLTTLLLCLLSTFSLSATDLYRVGNSGNWNDANHWALTSGGIGGAGIPTHSDNVFFDDGSFTGLTEVYIVSASAKSFHFDSQLASQVNFFGSVNSTLSVTGDVVFEQRVKSFHIDQLILKSSSGATLKTANNQFSTSISIQGSGQYSLDGYLVSQREGSTLNLAKGGLVTNGHQVFFRSNIVYRKSKMWRRLWNFRCLCDEGARIQ